MFDQLLMMFDLIKEASPEALVKALFVFTAVFALRGTKLLPDTKWSRAAVVFFSVIQSMALEGPMTQEEAVLIPLVLTFSTAIWELFTLAYSRVTNGRKPFTTPTNQ